MIAAGLTVLTMAAPAAAQDAGSAEPEALEARAVALEGQGPTQYDEAADLYREAAELREEGDPQAVEDLMRSGKLAYYAGNERRALSDLEKAAERALAFGDVVNAATAYLDAGWIADAMGDGARAYEFAVKGVRLSQSPLIEASLRRELQGRVQGSLVS